MKITLNSVMVNDQDNALKFYTEVLGFVKKRDIPVGQFRWLTVVSPEGPEHIELVLEPNELPAAVLYPSCLAPVEFIDYELRASNAEPRL